MPKTRLPLVTIMIGETAIHNTAEQFLCHKKYSNKIIIEGLNSDFFSVSDQKIFE